MSKGFASTRPYEGAEVLKLRSHPASLALPQCLPENRLPVEDVRNQIHGL